MKTALQQENGHTMVEVLTALIILIIVVWPASSFFSKMITSSQSKQLQTASQLAEQEMLSTVLNHNFRNEERQISPRLLLRKEIEKEQDLVSVTITVEDQLRKNRLLILRRRYLLTANRGGIDERY